MRSLIVFSTLALATLARVEFKQDCADGLDGLYPMGECETKFLTCSGSIARVMDCPADMVYSYKTESCDWPNNVENCEGEESGEESGQSGEGSGGASGEASGDASVDLSGEGSGSGNETLENGSEEFCIALEDGVYPADGCNDFYYVCAAHVTHYLSCPTPLFYDKASRKCAWKHLIEECGEEVIIIDESENRSGDQSGEVFNDASGDNSGEGSGAFELSPKICENDGYFSFGECSSTFTACTNGRQVLMFCPTGLAFSEKNQMCNYKLAVDECQEAFREASGEESGEQSGEQSGEEETSGESSGIEIGACDSLDNGLYALGCSSRVLSCQNGRQDIFECPNFMVFNEINLICDYPQTMAKCLIEEFTLGNVMEQFKCTIDGWFSSSLCSHTYHQCTAGRLVHFTCAERNSVFSVSKAQCIDESRLPQCRSN